MLNFRPRQLLLGLLVSVSAGNSLIFFAETENRMIISELITIIAACSAVLLATAIALRQNPSGPHGKTYLSLAIGLVLWLCADLIWATYELYFHVAAPIPSLSDLLWLAGYPFFAYNLFQTYKEFQKRINKKILIAGIIGNAIFLGYLIPLTVNLSDLSNQAGIAMFAVIIAYPVANAILTIPAFPILLGLWRDKPWSIPWTFKALSLFCIVVTDSWFAFIVITGLQEQVWLSSMLFGAEYLIMAGGLIWYNKFLAIYNNNHGSGLAETHQKRAAAIVGSANQARIKKKHPIDVIVAIILIAAVISYSIFVSRNTSATEVILPEEGDATIKIGALLPLTGTLSSFGESADASLRIAQKDINNYFSKAGSDIRIEIVIEDTKTDPAIAVEKLKNLESRGIGMVIGPATSASVTTVKEYADRHGILILSASSTAPQLAIPNDNVFRLVPDDSHQAEALAKKMWDDGIRVVVPMWRTDVFGEGLHSALEEKFEQLGGRVVDDGIGYKPPTGDFAASLHRINFIFWEQDLKALSSRVNDAVKQYGADKVGVYIVSFDEIVPIMIQAERHPELASIKWYGSDGSAQNSDLVGNVDAANFAIETSFVNPIYGVEENDKFNEVKEKINEETGHSHRSYAEVTYDALWVVALSYDKVGAQADVDTLRKALSETANSYDGITGKTLLNDAGDRRSGSYDFWTITRNDNDNRMGYQWKRIDDFRNENDALLADSTQS